VKVGSVAAFVLSAVLLVPSAAAPASNVRTLVETRVPIAALAQDGRRIAWLAPRARRVVGIMDVASGRRHALPTRRVRSDLGAPLNALGVIVLTGKRTVYVRYEAQGNTEEHFFVVTAAVDDRRERLIKLEIEGNRPYPPGEGPNWLIAEGGGTVLFQGEYGGLYRLAGRRRAVRLQRRGLGSVLAVSGARYATARRTSSGGCICNRLPAWSPDGSTIAFTSGVALGDPDPQGRPERVRVVPSAGGQSRVIAEGVDPDWAPDGSLISYTSLRQPVSVWVIRPDGTDGRRLLPGGYGADWHPDGSRLAFSRGDGFIYVAARDGSEVRRLIAGGGADWSLDGRRLAYVREGDIYVADADGTGEIRLTQKPRDQLTWNSDPAWSPDGRRIAYTTYRATFDQISATGVFLVNADGTGGSQLAVGRAAMPAWSPDGSRIAYAGWLPKRHLVRGTPSTEIFTAAPDGGGILRVTTTSPAEPRTAGFVKPLGKRKRAVSFRVPGVPRALALTRAFAAVLAEGFYGKRIVFLHPRTGRLLRQLDVPAETTGLSAAGTRVVFSAGNEIRLVEGRGDVTTIAVAAARPQGLSIEGRRVAWIENSGGRGRIRALTLPRP